MPRIHVGTSLSPLHPDYSQCLAFNLPPALLTLQPSSSQHQPVLACVCHPHRTGANATCSREGNPGPFPLAAETVLRSLSLPGPSPERAPLGTAVSQPGLSSGPLVLLKCFLHLKSMDGHQEALRYIAMPTDFCFLYIFICW